MSEPLYNLIMFGNPEVWLGDDGYVDFPIERFLEHTENHLVKQFQSLDENVISRLKKLPTLFAVEHEDVDTRIGRIKDIEVGPKNLRIFYKFSEERYPYPLTKGVLQNNWQTLNINKSKYEFYRTHWAIKECDILSFYEEYLKTLTGLAHQLKGTDKKVQLIYAFNGTGKTRLSREFRALLTSQMDEEDTEDRYTRLLYYNAFTEDLFYWDNDLEGDVEPKLKIQPNKYTEWVLQEQGQDQNAIAHFQHYTSEKLTPYFSPDFSGVTFSIGSGDDERVGRVKISKGEESIFIWSIFYSLLEQVINVLNIPEISERDTDRYDQLEYVFIDDPVTSLDENHLIELAVNMAQLIKGSQSNLKFIITTHSPLFYNVLSNELKSIECYFLSKYEDGGFELKKKKGAGNKAFAYHLHIKALIEQAINQNNVQRYHFMLLRNLYEKTAAFFGYREWSDLLNTVEGDKKAYLKRIIHFSSHSNLSSEEISELTEPEKQIVKLLLDNLTHNYGSWPKQEGKHG